MYTETTLNKYKVQLYSRRAILERIAVALALTKWRFLFILNNYPSLPPLASVWFSVVPSISMGLHFEPQEFNTAIKWWFEVNPSVGSDANLMVAWKCPLCSSDSLDPWGIIVVPAKRGGDVTLRHNTIHDVLFNTLHRSGVSSHLEVGSGWGQDGSRT